MYKEIEVASIGLIIWQLIIFILLIVVVYLVVKLYKLITNYLSLKVKYLNKKIESE